MLRRIQAAVGRVATPTRVFVFALWVAGLNMALGAWALVVHFSPRDVVGLAIVGGLLYGVDRAMQRPDWPQAPRPFRLGSLCGVLILLFWLEPAVIAKVLSGDPADEPFFVGFTAALLWYVLAWLWRGPRSLEASGLE